MTEKAEHLIVAASEIAHDFQKSADLLELAIVNQVFTTSEVQSFIKEHRQDLSPDLISGLENAIRETQDAQEHLATLAKINLR